MSEVRIIVRTADQARKAELSLDRSNTGGDVIQAAVDNWSLPSDTRLFAREHELWKSDPPDANASGRRR